MKTQPYFKSFTTEAAARNALAVKNELAAAHEIYCLVDGPQDDFVIVDLQTAIELEIPYEWSGRRKEKSRP
jgi:hypothetical protein